MTRRKRRPEINSQDNVCKCLMSIVRIQVDVLCVVISSIVVIIILTFLKTNLIHRVWEKLIITIEDSR